MGDFADGMLDGTFCAGCGEYIGDSSGFAAYCSRECEPDYVEPEYRCDVCNRKFKSDEARNQHRRDKHGR